MGIKHRFINENKLAGKDWLSGFMSRHPNLAIRKLGSTSLAKAVGFNKPQVEKFFAVYQDVLKTHSYNPTRIWNMDETGTYNLQKPAKIMATKGAGGVGKMTSGEKGKAITNLCATNAAETYIPPMLIFSRKRIADPIMNNAPIHRRSLDF